MHNIFHTVDGAGQMACGPYASHHMACRPYASHGMRTICITSTHIHTTYITYFNIFTIGMADDMRTIRDKAPPPPPPADRRAGELMKNGPRKDAPVHGPLACVYLCIPMCVCVCLCVSVYACVCACPQFVWQPG